MSFLGYLSHHGACRLSTDLFWCVFFLPRLFTLFLIFLLLKPPKTTTKRHQPCYWKPSYKKPNRNPLSRAERNIKNTIIEGIVKIIINDKAESKNNNILYGYHSKLLNEYENILPWIKKNNQIPSNGL